MRCAPWWRACGGAQTRRVVQCGALFTPVIAAAVMVFAGCCLRCAVECSNKQGRAVGRLQQWERTRRPRGGDRSCKWMRSGAELGAQTGQCRAQESRNSPRCSAWRRRGVRRQCRSASIESCRRVYGALFGSSSRMAHGPASTGSGQSSFQSSVGSLQYPWAGQRTMDG